MIHKRILRDMFIAGIIGVLTGCSLLKKEFVQMEKEHMPSILSAKYAFGDIDGDGEQDLVFHKDCASLETVVIDEVHHDLSVYTSKDIDTITGIELERTRRHEDEEFCSPELIMHNALDLEKALSYTNPKIRFCWTDSVLLGTYNLSILDKNKDGFVDIVFWSTFRKTQSSPRIEFATVAYGKGHFLFYQPTYKREACELNEELRKELGLK